METYPGFQYLLFWCLPIIRTVSLFISLIRYWQEELRTLILNLIWESESLYFPVSACPWVTATIICWFAFTCFLWRLHYIFLLLSVSLPDTEDANSNQHETSASAHSCPHPCYLPSAFLNFLLIIFQTERLQARKFLKKQFWNQVLIIYISCDTEKRTRWSPLYICQSISEIQIN